MAIYDDQNLSDLAKKAYEPFKGAAKSPQNLAALVRRAVLMGQLSAVEKTNDTFTSYEITQRLKKEFPR